MHGHEFKFLGKQTNEEVHSSSVNLEEKLQSKKKKSKNHEYFDSDCYNKRKELQMLENLLEKNPDNLTIRQSYHQTKRLYESMIKSKKGEHIKLKLKLFAGLKPNEIKRN